MDDIVDITNGAVAVDVRGGDACDTASEQIATLLKGCTSAKQLTALLQRHPEEASSCVQLAADITADIKAAATARPEKTAEAGPKSSTSVLPAVVKAEVAASAPVSTNDAHFLFADLPFVTPKGKHNLFIRCDAPDGAGGALILQSKGAAPGSVGPAGVSIPLDSISGVFSLAVGDRYGKGVTSSILLSLSHSSSWHSLHCTQLLCFTSSCVRRNVWNNWTSKCRLVCIHYQCQCGHQYH
jgi:hypothetical protein